MGIHYFTAQIHPPSKYETKNSMPTNTQITTYSMEEMRTRNLKGLPVSIEHSYKEGDPKNNIVCGSVDYSTVGENGEWIIFFHIDDSTEDGKQALMLYENGLLPEMSLSHLVHVDEHNRVSEKLEIEVSMVERGRRPGSVIKSGPTRTQCRYNASAKEDLKIVGIRHMYPYSLMVASLKTSSIASLITQK